MISPDFGPWSCSGDTSGSRIETSMPAVQHPAHRRMSLSASEIRSDRSESRSTGSLSRPPSALVMRMFALTDLHRRQVAAGEQLGEAGGVGPVISTWRSTATSQRIASFTRFQFCSGSPKSRGCTCGCTWRSRWHPSARWRRNTAICGSGCRSRNRRCRPGAAGACRSWSWVAGCGSTGRVTLRVMPQLGITELCFPAPPMTTTLMLAAARSSGRGRRRSDAASRAPRLRSDALQFADPHPGLVEEIGGHIVAGPAVGGAGRACSGHRATKYSPG